MNTEIRPPLQAGLCYTVLIVCVITLYSSFISPALSSLKNNRQQITSIHIQDTRFSQAIHEYQALLSENNSAPAQTSNIADLFSPLYLHADTAPLAGANLQVLLRNIIENNGAELNVVAFIRRTEPSLFPIITVSLRLNSSVESLQQILHQIESHETKLFVENLFVQSSHQEGRVINNLTDELEVRFDVTGYLNNSSTAE